MPEISVILPNYNHAPFLKQRIDSILHQTFQDFELIILDDCSTDNSREVIERYRNNPKVSQIVFNKINGGTSYKQWSKGIELANGKLIWIAESDDVAALNFLENIIWHFNKANVSLVFSQTDNFSNDLLEKQYQVSEVYEEYDNNTFIKNKLLIKNTIFNGSMAVFRRDKYLSIATIKNNKGLYWYDMKFAGDWFLWLLLSYNSKVVEVKDVLNYRRIHDNNATNRFRLKGYDITEGLDVLFVAKKMVNNKYSKSYVYNGWLDKYELYKQFFSTCVKINVMTKIFIADFPLFGFIVKAKIKSLNIVSFVKSTIKRII